MTRSSVLSLATIVVVAVGITIISWPSNRLMPDDRSIVVVEGPSRTTAADALNRQVSSATLPNVQAIGDTLSSKHTELTNEEYAEIDKLDASVRQETRNDLWAFSAEKSIINSVSQLASIRSRDSTVVCGSISCFFTVRIPQEASEYNKLAAIEAIEHGNVPDGDNGSLFTSRMFSEKQADGSFIIRALIIRS